MRGKCKWFNKDKGYGFISVENTGDDAFVHYSEIQDPPHGFKVLREGQEVEFELEQTQRGLQAKNVRPA